MSGIKIESTGMSLPEMVVTNEDFTRIVDTSDEWIKTRTGISTRHLSNGEPLWHLSVDAAQKALAAAETNAEEIDLIIHTSITSDYISPSMACLVQGKIGAVNATGFDINCACAGYVYALDMARRYLCTGDFKKVLIISSEMLSKVTNYKDRSTCVLFGDGAAATVVTAADSMFASYLKSDGTGAKHIFARTPAAENPFADPSHSVPCDDFAENKAGVLYMNGKEVYKFATKAMAEAVEEAAKKAGIAVDDLDVIVPHQANIRIVETAASRLGQPMEKFFVNVEKYGNTSSASIPICLCELDRRGGLKRGDKVCIVGFGAGLTYGAAVFEW